MKILPGSPLQAEDKLSEEQKEIIQYLFSMPNILADL
jgi:hypothetical protein